MTEGVQVASAEFGNLAASVPRVVSPGAPGCSSEPPSTANSNASTGSRIVFSFSSVRVHTHLVTPAAHTTTAR